MEQRSHIQKLQYLIGFLQCSHLQCKLYAYISLPIDKLYTNSSHIQRFSIWDIIQAFPPGRTQTVKVLKSCWRFQWMFNFKTFVRIFLLLPPQEGISWWTHIITLWGKHYAPSCERRFLPHRALFRHILWPCFCDDFVVSSCLEWQPSYEWSETYSLHIGDI